MHSTLYKQLKVYVDDILNKDGYYKRIKKNNLRTYIFFGALFIMYIFLIFLSTSLIYKFITNAPILKLLPIRRKWNKESVTVYYFIFVSFFTILLTSLFVFLEPRIHPKKPYITINPIDKSAITNEVIFKMKLNQEIKKTLNNAFKNADDKNDVKHILLNETKINNDKKLSQITGNLLYYFITSLIAIILTTINAKIFKIQLILIVIVFLIFSIIIKYFYTEPITFSNNLLEIYIKDYIMNYWLPIHYCRNSK